MHTDYQIIPKVMFIGKAELLDEVLLCAFEDLSGSEYISQGPTNSHLNHSFMLSPELSEKQRGKLSQILKILS